MHKIPTDHEILYEIYQHYYDEFAQYKKEPGERKTKTYVPIDIDLIAKALDVDGDIVFGRLHFHLEKKFGHTEESEDGSMEYTPFFLIKSRWGERHLINFPLMASILADLIDREEKFQTNTYMAIGALAISGLSLVLSFCSLFWGAPS
jgi:hypothetical protein